LWKNSLFILAQIEVQSRNKAGRVKDKYWLFLQKNSDFGIPDELKISVYFRFVVLPVTLLSGEVIFPLDKCADF
jgi:hypothetical protein